MNKVGQVDEKPEWKRISQITLYLLLIFLSGCSRNEPTSAIISDPALKEINPISTYTLDISEPSGIAYNNVKNTLMIVSDSKPIIYEVSLAGVTLNRIDAAGVDMEAIALSANCDTIYVAEERARQITLFTPTGSRLLSFKADVAVVDNSALEGVSVKKSDNRIFILNEKDPCMLLCYQNLTEVFRKRLGYTGDVSDICYEDSTGFLWVLSDESRMILKLDEAGNLLDKWEIPFSKGEGIAVAGDKLYIVNDQDGKMYVFNRPN